VTYDEVGVALAVPLAAARSGAVPAISQFKNVDATKPVDEVIATAPVPVATDLSGDGLPDPAAWFATTFTADANGFTYLHGRLLYEHSGSGAIVVGSLVSNYTSIAYQPESVAVAVNGAGEPYVLSCTDDQLHAIQSLDSQPTDPELEDGTANLGGLCFVSSDPYPSGADEILDFTRCTAGQCRTYAMQKSTDLIAGPGTLTGETWLSGQRRAGAQPLQILRDTTGLVVRDEVAGTDYRLFDGEGLVSGDAALVGGDLFAVGIVDHGDGPEVELVYGQYPTVQPIAMPFVPEAGMDVVPTAVALHADDDRVVVVVMARDSGGAVGQDAVGWVFLGKP
jgi:hypothetical protein